ncbi:HU family DNA-binding protein [Sinirhodobacter populi]|uniref:HU family DNA-binding protein n=1 Tax=Paenirhodobacter populi TaxID=2306993 RepID=A0A443K267_9RHOB|nr:HU family DNA-binding protein [Sinirhodobacter populi]RWR26813.1 HU family DNA-binding protein [Sinirhodobacter populi]
MKRLTKAELVERLAESSNLTKTKAELVLTALAIIVGDAVLVDGMRVTLPDLGTFALKHRAARTGRNPATGEAIQIPASTTISFKPAKRGA